MQSALSLILIRSRPCRTLILSNVSQLKSTEYKGRILSSHFKVSTTTRPICISTYAFVMIFSRLLLLLQRVTSDSPQSRAAINFDASSRRGLLPAPKVRSKTCRRRFYTNNFTALTCSLLHCGHWQWRTQRGGMWSSNPPLDDWTQRLG